MNLLIKILSLILLFLVFIITLIACLYVLVQEIDWILEVDVLWKLKRKVRCIVYGQTKSDREVVGRMFRRRKGRSIRNRERLQTVKARLFNRQDNFKTIQISQDKTNQKA